MGFFIRVFSALNTAREWLTFANETASFLGLAKRAAAVTAGAAVMAAPAVAYKAVTAPAPQMQIVSAAPGQVMSSVALKDKIEKIAPDNIYSKTYLRQPEHRPLLEAIVAKCESGNDLPAAQCDIADSILKSVKHREYLAGLHRESEARDKAFRDGLKKPITGPEPTQIKMFAD